MVCTGWSVSVRYSKTSRACVGMLRGTRRMLVYGSARVLDCSCGCRPLLRLVLVIGPVRLLFLSMRGRGQEDVRRIVWERYGELLNFFFCVFAAWSRQALYCCSSLLPSRFYCSVCLVLLCQINQINSNARCCNRDRFCLFVFLFVLLSFVSLTLTLVHVAIFLLPSSALRAQANRDGRGGPPTRAGARTPPD